MGRRRVEWLQLSHQLQAAIFVLAKYHDKHIIKNLGTDSAKFDGIRRLASSATV